MEVPIILLASDYMSLAVAAAKRGGPATYTNPQVGAVIVKNGQVLATGYHHYFGGVHAEVDAMQQLTATQLSGATLYVTLEPCSHFGKTPPCCRRIVAAGLQKVVIGQLDPHPLVTGHGQDYLKSHGITVETGCLAATVATLNRHYDWFYHHQRPWITLKYAITLDGKLTAQRGQRSLISNHASYIDSQHVRQQFQAILIGEQTLAIDDPQLTVRLTTLAHPPVRLVLLNNSTAAVHAKLTQPATVPTYLLCRQAAASDAHFAAQSNVHICIADWTPAKVSAWCAQNGWQSLLVEGGSHLQADFVAAQLVDELIIYLAPTLFGGQGLPTITGASAARPLTFTAPKVTVLGDNLKLCLQRKEAQ